MEERLKKLEAAGGPVVLRLVEHMVQRDAGKRKTVKVRRENNFRSDQVCAGPPNFTSWSDLFCFSVRFVYVVVYAAVLDTVFPPRE